MVEQRKSLTADQRDQAGAPAKRRVNITERRDLRALATELGCTSDELKAAVAQVGNIVSDVETYLKGKTTQSTQVDKAQASAALHALFGPET